MRSCGTCTTAGGDATGLRGKAESPPRGCLPPESLLSPFQIPEQALPGPAALSTGHEGVEQYVSPAHSHVLTVGNRSLLSSNQIFDCGEKAMRVILEEAESSVAGGAEQATKLASGVYMVNAKPTLSWEPTDRAETILSSKEPVICAAFSNQTQLLSQARLFPWPHASPLLKATLKLCCISARSLVDSVQRPRTCIMSRTRGYEIQRVVRVRPSPAPRRAGPARSPGWRWRGPCQ